MKSNERQGPRSHVSPRAPRGKGMRKGHQLPAHPLTPPHASPPHHPPPPLPPITTNWPSCLSALLNFTRHHNRIAVLEHFAQNLRRRARVLRAMADFVPQADAPARFGFSGGFERGVVARGFWYGGLRLVLSVVVVGV